MAAEVHDIAAQRPHLTVAASNGVHVIPCELIRAVVEGKKPSAILSELVVQRIIEEWLQQVTK